MKKTLSLFVLLILLCVLPCSSLKDAQAQEPGKEKDEAQTIEQLSDEDKVVIENLELLEHLNLLLENDIDMIYNLDLLLANS